MKYLLLTLCLLLSTFVARAEVQLHELFSHNMVLQRDRSVPVWGTAGPGEKLTVSIGGQSKSTQADAVGYWQIDLGAMPVADNLTLLIQGNNRITLKNVAIGDVYLCSGQSNMQRPVNWANNAQTEIAAANYPNIRLMSVPRKVAGTPQKDFATPLRWDVCTPSSAIGFSGVAYFFGREVHQRLGIPIGLIHASWGGSIAETWISRDTLLKRDDFRDATLKTERDVAEQEARGSYKQQMAAWWHRNDKHTAQNGSIRALNDSDWRPIRIPSPAPQTEETSYNAAVWFRKILDLPETWTGKNIVLHIGDIQQHTAYLNGVAIGSSPTTGRRRAYGIPANQVKGGRNVIAIRVLASDYGFRGIDTQRLELATDAKQSISLAGEWKYEIGVSLKDAPPPKNLDADPNSPTLAYNAMIAPLIPFSVRGVIWYQGESNARRPAQYQTLFPDLIRDWRTQWGAKQNGSDFGFYFVQLPNYKKRVTEPVESSLWAELREAQAMALELPRTGMATTIDIGEADDIHPRNKQDVGKRLALVALAKEYAQDIEYSGPMFHGMKIEGKRVRLSFSHARGLKTLDGGTPRAFAIESQDNRWHHASARIDGQSVVIWNDEVLKPIAIRYAWANNPDVNLVNAAGLPAVPFRTDANK